ncbi:uncharacterized protein BJ171DRAFT_162964 [Polychytrium aggregatum]|uniref:uncharacterized protein n=1 Tax=Polychytrium aggregatum TaxID=110093 RepID=UPI0022FEF6D8|nr:uncharacterized protein BJ171DRAFT_162964 [Polychytrium aggregatum]KAI9202862.1 hypothetical protein BJ171DRAFT_162964 [Polychytrium aggregatum]
MSCQCCFEVAESDPLVQCSSNPTHIYCHACTNSAVENFVFQKSSNYGKPLACFGIQGCEGVLKNVGPALEGQDPLQARRYKHSLEVGKAEQYLEIPRNGLRKCPSCGFYQIDADMVRTIQEREEKERREQAQLLWRWIQALWGTVVGVTMALWSWTPNLVTLDPAEDWEGLLAEDPFPSLSLEEDTDRSSRSTTGNDHWQPGRSKASVQPMAEPQVETTFRCCNDDCRATICLRCTCPIVGAIDEHQRECQQSLRKLPRRDRLQLLFDSVLEEARSRAIKLVCPKCHLAITKTTDERSCNKMTCPNCRIHMCWVCHYTIRGYDHFCHCHQQRWLNLISTVSSTTGRCSDCNRCPLYEFSTTDAQRRSLEKAKSRFMEAYPDFTPRDWLTAQIKGWWRTLFKR